MSAATQTKARSVVRKVPGVWRLDIAGVVFTATVEHIRNPGRRWFRRITVTSSTSLPYVPCEVHGYLESQIETALGGDWPSWLRVWWHDHWRTFRHRVSTIESSLAEIRAAVVKVLQHGTSQERN